MGRITAKKDIAVARLVPYARNAKTHSPEQVQKIADSIREFGFLSPVLVDPANNIIAGHGRVLAAQEMGLEKVPCIVIDGLTEEQRRAYILADNRLAELAEWNMDIVRTELEDLAGLNFDIDLTGFEIEIPDDWFQRSEFDGTQRQEGNDEYNEFLDKFEIKKTTDDCYTPEVVYEAVADFVEKRYKLKRQKFIRPFYPGGDYESENYDGKVVVDNPPFSILSEICAFYAERRIGYFLFAPTLTLFGLTSKGATAIPVGCTVTYENGAAVNTSFLTNLEPSDIVATNQPELYDRVQDAADEYAKSLHKNLPKYDYPDHIVTSPMMAKMSKYGVPLVIKREDIVLVSELDAQKEQGKAIYGKGFLLSEKAAAEKAAAEKAAAITWQLSEREWGLVHSLGVKNEHEQENTCRAGE